MTLRRYARLLLVQLRASLLLAMQYRSEFLLEGAIEVLWTSSAIAPLLVLYGHRDRIAGWTFGESLVVVGFFVLLGSVLEGAINPSLAAVVEHVRKGTLDFVLLKPADAQFLVSTARFHPWRGINAVTAMVVFVVAFRDLGRAPSFGGLALAAVLFVAAIATLYSLWLLTVCVVFYAVKIDNVGELLNAIFDAARWPSSVFRGVAHFVFTFVIPLTLMTTVPARALLGAIDARTVAGSIAGAAVFAVIARFAWRRALAGYTSAGG